MLCTSAFCVQYISVVDPDPNESTFDFDVRIRIRIGNASPEPGALKLSKIFFKNLVPAFQKDFCAFGGMFYWICYLL